MSDRLTRITPVAIAHATMTRGTTFLRARAPMLGSPSPRETQGRRARAIGNVLRELDHFLNILVQATRAERDLPVDTGRNTARQFRSLRTALHLSDASHHRLNALGRSRACLFHCGGQVRRADTRGGTWMTAGWPERGEGRALHRAPLGAMLSPGAAELTDVCRFYEDIARDLLALAASPALFTAAALA